MALPLSSLYLQEADWATREYYAPKVQDVVFNSNALTAILRKNARVINSGTRIDGFAQFKKGTQGGWIPKSGTYAHTFERVHDAATWNPKILTEPVSVYIADLLMNQGNEQRRFDLSMQMNEGAAKTMADNFGSALFSIDYTNTDAIDSLDRAVNNQTGSSDETGFSAVYGGITRAATGDGATWNANVDDTNATLNLSVLNDTYLDCAEGTDTPDLVVSNNKAFSFYYDELTPIQRQGTEDLIGKGGFTAAVFNNCPWIIDSHCPSADRVVPAAGAGFGTAPASEYVYMLNTSSIEIVAWNGAFFDYMGTMQPIDQWALVGRYFFMGNVVCYNPRLNGKLTAITS